jgi:hypothetical protein
VLGAAGDIAYVSPATPSAGVIMEMAETGQGWDVGFSINTEHSVLINTLSNSNTTGYTYGAMENRNGWPIAHSGQWIHAQLLDCKYGITVGSYVSAGADLDIFGLDDQYSTSGVWTQAYLFHTGPNLGGFMTWQGTTDGVGSSFTTSSIPVFDTGSGTRYTVEVDGNFNQATFAQLNFAGASLSTPSNSSFAIMSFGSPSQIWQVATAGSATGDWAGKWYLYDQTGGHGALTISPGSDAANFTGTVTAPGYFGPSTAPTGSCSANGEWVFSQDGHATLCSSGTWVTKI